jgi:outer membrane protein assembly factor BamB
VNDTEQRRLWILAFVALIGAIIFVVTRPAPAPAPASIAEVPPPVDPALLLPEVIQPTAAPLPVASDVAEWAMEGLNPARTRSTNVALPLPLTSQRSIGAASADEAGSPPVVARGLALIELKDRLQAIELATGRERWSFVYRGLYISPAVSGDMVYVRVEANNAGQVIALDLDTGAQLWAFTPRRFSRADTGYVGGHITSPVIVDSTVFVGAGQEVYALDALSGALRWEFTAQDLITSSAAVADERVYISDFKYTYALDINTGAMAWAQPTESAIYFAPVVAGDTLLISSGDRLLALRQADGGEIWAAEIPGESLIPAGVQGGIAFVKSTVALYGYDLANGAQRWKYANINFVSLPAVADDRAFVVSGMAGNSELVALDIATGASIWAQPLRTLAPTAPVIAGQAIYVRTVDGQVVSLWG